MPAVLVGDGFARTVCRPHLLEVVELAHLGTEDVDDDVAGVEQHPVARIHALDAHAAEPSEERAADVSKLGD